MRRVKREKASHYVCCLHCLTLDTTLFLPSRKLCARKEVSVELTRRTASMCDVNRVSTIAGRVIHYNYQEDVGRGYVVQLYGFEVKLLLIDCRDVCAFHNK
jgi:hypothetical protein